MWFVGQNIHGAEEARTGSFVFLHRCVLVCCLPGLYIHARVNGHAYNTV